MTDYADLASRSVWVNIWVCSLLHFLWQATVVGTLHLIGVFLLSGSKADARYVWGVVCLLLLICCPILTFGWLWAAMDQTGYAVAVPFVASPELAVLDQINLPEVPRLESDGEKYRAPTGFRTALFCGWVVGVMVLSLRLVVGAVFVCWVRRQSFPLPASVLSQVDQLRRQLKISAHVIVAASKRVNTAVACGLLRPMVLLPTAWLVGLSPDMLQAVIAHELAHIVRCDLWVNLLQRAAETLWFYHPAVWWISASIRREREVCCDQLAVSTLRSPLQYAETLEFLATSGLAGAAPFWFAAGIGGSRMSILNRVHHILGIKPGRSPSVIWPTILMFTACMGCAIFAIRGVHPADAATQDSDLLEKIDALAVDQAADAVDQAAAPQKDDSSDKVDLSIEDLRRRLNTARRQLRDYELLIEELQIKLDRAQAVEQQVADETAQRARESRSQPRDDHSRFPMPALMPPLELERIVANRQRLDMQLKLLDERRKLLEAQMAQVRKRSTAELAARQEAVQAELKCQLQQLEIQQQRVKLEAMQQELQKERRQREIHRRVVELTRLRQKTEDEDEQQRLERALEETQAESADMEKELALAAKIRALDLKAEENKIGTEHKLRLRQLEAESQAQLEARLEQVHAELQQLELQRLQLRLELEGPKAVLPDR